MDPQPRAMTSGGAAASLPVPARPSAPPLLALSVSKVVGWLGGGAALLVMLALLGYVIRYGLGYELTASSVFYYHFIKFDLEGEANFPAWYGSVLLLLCAILSAAIAALRSGERHSLHWQWLGLAVIFLGMSADEVAVIHELTIAPLRKVLGLGGLLWHSWVILGAAMVVLVGLIYLPFLARLPRATAGRILAAGLVFVSGAIGLEMIGGAMIEAHGRTNLPYVLVMSCEEAAEMAGLILYIRALLLYVRDHVGEVTLNLHMFARPSAMPPTRLRPDMRPPRQKNDGSPPGVSCARLRPLRFRRRSRRDPF